MPPFSPWMKRHSEAPSTSAPASGLPSSRVIEPLQFPTNSQSDLQSPQEQQLLQSVGGWSTHIPPSEKGPSPFPRCRHAISTTATAASELFLFGGVSNYRRSSDLYVISTRDFSTTLLQTSGDVPSPRFGHCAMFTSTILLIWGGTIDDDEQWSDDSFYLLNLVSREWTRIVVNGPGPGGRFYHSMTLVGSKLFVFGGRSDNRRFNDIWALDLNCFKSNPFWESYEPALGNEKPLLRAGHVSVTTGDRIVIFGGRDDSHYFNDTWSFNISTRKWTELQCTGSIPSPRASHAAVLIDDVMYVYGGSMLDRTKLGDLTALNLTTQRWTAFQGIGPSPSGRYGHAMACDGTRIFVLGGISSSGVQADESKLIHVLDTQHLVYPEPDPDAVSPNEKTAQLVGRSSASPPTRGQPHQSSSSSDAHAAHHASPSRKATPGELGHPTSQRITGKQTPSLSGLPSQPTGVRGRPRRVPEEDDDSESSTGHHTKPVAPDAPSRKGIARLENGRLVELERQLSEMVFAKAESDRHIVQLTALQSSLLAKAAEEKKRAGLELRNLQAKLDESLLSRDQAEANVAEEKKRAGLELRELQAKLDGSLLSHDHAGLKQRELQAKLDELQAKFDQLMLSRNEDLRTPEQAQSGLQKATSPAVDAEERSQPAWEHVKELAELRAELEGKKSELATVRLRLTDAEDGWAKLKVEADTLRVQTAAGLVNTDVDRVMHRLMERVRAMEAEVLSLRGNEKSIEDMECRNEG